MRKSTGRHGRAAPRQADEHFALDKSSSTPAYVQIANRLRLQIAQQHYRPGDTLATVKELAVRFGVAAMTVRQAISQLVEERLVVREQGRGTFVQQPDLSSAKFNLDRLTELLTDKALGEQTLRSTRVRANAQVAATLNVNVDDLVLYVERVLIRHGKPLFYQWRYVLVDSDRPLAEAEKGPDSMRALFQGYAESGIKHGLLTLHPHVLSRSEAGHIHCAAGIAAWAIDYVYLDFDEQPVAFGRLICRGDSLSFSVPVGISDPAAIKHQTPSVDFSASRYNRRDPRAK